MVHFTILTNGGVPMTDRELQHLSRSELLELLIAQMEENALLKLQLKSAMAQLEHKNIEILKAGSLAEAALKLNGIFQAADAAAKQYLDNVRRLADEGKLEL